MKVSAVIIVISAIISMALSVLMYLKRNDEAIMVKKSSFMDIKVRVTRDVLGEYQTEAEKMQTDLDEGTKEVQAQNLILQNGKAENKPKSDELAACHEELKKMREETTAERTELKAATEEDGKERAGWEKEIADLKQQLEQKSKVCDFVKKDSAEGMKLCGTPLPEPPKQEAPKVEAPKAEAPKAEPPKAEAPKAEPPKAEAPKAEAPKAEAPKAEAPKAEAPKAEEPKAEAPKAEEPKAEAPKAEEPKAEAPKPK
ncbi:uncharacterized protein zgc:174935 [Conger conger]|uniref:uncharacterized protein zgc:174935 n=1 Tax=Conger conger TaxID=82655 RepID=UPI002A59E283|nr:uncharacterized protein zgc:174935 [Conger conger]